MEHIYFAYGSNLNKAQMKFRCPNAELVDTGMIKDYRLIFRHVADIIHEPYCDEHVEVGIWRITNECLASLDIYEGYPSLYRRETLEAESHGAWGTWQGITYLMNRKSVDLPSPDYYESIEQGFYDCNLDISKLQSALHETMIDCMKQDREKFYRYA